MTRHMLAGLDHFSGQGAYISLNTSIVTYLVELIGGDAGLDSSSDYIEDFSSEFARLSHGILCLFIQDINVISSGPRVPGITICRPDWMWNVFGNFSSR